MLLVRQLGKVPESVFGGGFVSAKGWLQDMEPTVSINREVLGEKLAAYWRGTVETVATPSPRDVATLLHWRSMMHLLAEVPEEVRTQVHQAPLVGGSAGDLHGAVAIDGHCHLELTHQWLQDMEPTVSINREVLGEKLAAYWRGTVETVATPSPRDVATLLHWRSMMHLLAEVPEEVRTQVHQAPLVGGSAGDLHGAVAIDGHCHLELTR